MDERPVGDGLIQPPLDSVHAVLKRARHVLDVLVKRLNLSL